MNIQRREWFKPSDLTPVNDGRYIILYHKGGIFHTTAIAQFAIEHGPFENVFVSLSDSNLPEDDNWVPMENVLFYSLVEE